MLCFRIHGRHGDGQTDESKFVTGSELVIYGGYTCH